MNEGRRQWVLLGVLAVLVLVYLRFGNVSFGFGGGGGAAVADLPPIDAAGLETRLKGINTVNARLIEPSGDPTATERNLFQYGVKKPPPPPPPDPAEVERQRLAAERALREAEEAARRRREEEEARRRAAEEAARRRAEEEARRRAAEPPPQPASRKPPPPPINFRYVGVFGPASNKIAVLLDGQEPILVREGQVVKEQFRILDIEIEWTDVGYVDPDYEETKKRLNLGS